MSTKLTLYKYFESASLCANACAQLTGKSVSDDILSQDIPLDKSFTPTAVYFERRQLIFRSNLVPDEQRRQSTRNTAGCCAVITAYVKRVRRVGFHEIRSLLDALQSQEGLAHMRVSNFYDAIEMYLITGGPNNTTTSPLAEQQRRRASTLRAADVEEATFVTGSYFVLFDIKGITSAVPIIALPTATSPEANDAKASTRVARLPRSKGKTFAANSQDQIDDTGLQLETPFLPTPSSTLRSYAFPEELEGSPLELVTSPSQLTPTPATSFDARRSSIKQCTESLLVSTPPRQGSAAAVIPEARLPVVSRFAYLNDLIANVHSLQKQQCKRSVAVRDLAASMGNPQPTTLQKVLRDAVSHDLIVLQDAFHEGSGQPLSRYGADSPVLNTSVILVGAQLMGLVCYFPSDSSDVHLMMREKEEIDQSPLGTRATRGGNAPLVEDSLERSVEALRSRSKSGGVQTLNLPSTNPADDRFLTLISAVDRAPQFDQNPIKEVAGEVSSDSDDIEFVVTSSPKQREAHSLGQSRSSSMADPQSASRGILSPPTLHPTAHCPPLNMSFFSPGAAGEAPLSSSPNLRRGSVLVTPHLNAKMTLADLPEVEAAARGELCDKFDNAFVVVKQQQRRECSDLLLQLVDELVSVVEPRYRSRLINDHRDEWSRIAWNIITTCEEETRRNIEGDEEPALRVSIGNSHYVKEEALHRKQTEYFEQKARLEAMWHQLTKVEGMTRSDLTVQESLQFSVMSELEKFQAVCWRGLSRTTFRAEEQTRRRHCADFLYSAKLLAASELWAAARFGGHIDISDELHTLGEVGNVRVMQHCLVEEESMMRDLHIEHDETITRRMWLQPVCRMNHSEIELRGRLRSEEASGRSELFQRCLVCLEETQRELIKKNEGTLRQRLRESTTWGESRSQLQQPPIVVKCDPMRDLVDDEGFLRLYLVTQCMDEFAARMISSLAASNSSLLTRRSYLSQTTMEEWSYAKYLQRKAFLSYDSCYRAMAQRMEQFYRLESCREYVWQLESAARKIICLTERSDRITRVALLQVEEECSTQLRQLKKAESDGWERSVLLLDESATRINGVVIPERIARTFSPLFVTSRLEVEELNDRFEHVALREQFHRLTFIDKLGLLERERIARSQIQRDQDAQFQLRINRATAVERDSVRLLSAATEQINSSVIQVEQVFRRLLCSRFLWELKSMLSGEMIGESQFDMAFDIAPAFVGEGEHSTRRALELSQHSSRCALLADHLIKSRLAVACRSQELESEARAALKERQQADYKRIFHLEVSLITKQRIVDSERHDWERRIMHTFHAEMEEISRSRIDSSEELERLSIASTLLFTLERLVRARNVERWESHERLIRLAEPCGRRKIAIDAASGLHRLSFESFSTLMSESEGRDRAHLCREQQRSLFNRILLKEIESRCVLEKQSAATQCCAENFVAAFSKLFCREEYERKVLVLGRDYDIYNRQPVLTSTRSALFSLRMREELQQAQAADAELHRCVDSFYDVSPTRGLLPPVESGEYIDVSDFSSSGLLSITSSLLRARHDALHTRRKSIQAEEVFARLQLAIAFTEDDEMEQRHVMEHRQLMHTALLSKHFLARVLERDAFEQCTSIFCALREEHERRRIVTQHSLGALQLSLTTIEEPRDREQIAQREKLAAYDRLGVPQLEQVEGVARRVVLQEQLFSFRKSITFAAAESVERISLRSEMSCDWSLLLALCLVDKERIGRDVVQRTQLLQYSQVVLRFEEAVDRWRNIISSETSDRFDIQQLEVVECESAGRSQVSRSARNLLSLRVLEEAEGRERLRLVAQADYFFTTACASFDSATTAEMVAAEQKCRVTLARCEATRRALVVCDRFDEPRQRIETQQQYSDVMFSMCKIKLLELEEVTRNSVAVEETKSRSLLQCVLADEERGRIQIAALQENSLLLPSQRFRFLLQQVVLREAATKELEELIMSSPRRLRQSVLVPICADEEMALRTALLGDEAELRLQLAEHSIKNREALCRTAILSEGLTGCQLLNDRYKSSRDLLHICLEESRLRSSGVEIPSCIARCAIMLRELQESCLWIKQSIHRAASEAAVRRYYHWALRDEESLSRAALEDAEVATRQCQVVHPFDQQRMSIHESSQRKVLFTQWKKKCFAIAFDSLELHLLQQRRQIVSLEASTRLARIQLPELCSCESQQRCEVSASASKRLHMIRFVAQSTIDRACLVRDEEASRAQVLQTTNQAATLYLLIEIDRETLHRRSLITRPWMHQFDVIRCHSYLLLCQAQEEADRQALRRAEWQALWEQFAFRECVERETACRRAALLQENDDYTVAISTPCSHGSLRILCSDSEAHGRRQTIDGEMRELFSLWFTEVQQSESIARRELETIRADEHHATTFTVLALNEEPVWRSDRDRQWLAQHAALVHHLTLELNILNVSIANEPITRNRVVADEHSAFICMLFDEMVQRETAERMEHLHNNAACAFARLYVTEICWREDVPRGMILLEEAVHFKNLVEQEHAQARQTLIEVALREEKEMLEAELVALDHGNAGLEHELDVRTTAFEVVDKALQEHRQLARANRRARKELSRIQQVLAEVGPQTDVIDQLLSFAEQDATATTLLRGTWEALAQSIAATTPDSDVAHALSFDGDSSCAGSLASPSSQCPCPTLAEAEQSVLPRSNYSSFTQDMIDRTRAVSSRLDAADAFVRKCEASKREIIDEVVESSDFMRTELSREFHKEMDILLKEIIRLEQMDVEFHHHLIRGTGTSTVSRHQSDVRQLHQTLAKELVGELRGKSCAEEAEIVRQYYTQTQLEIARLQEAAAECHKKTEQQLSELRRHNTEKKSLHASLEKQVADLRFENDVLKERSLKVMAARNQKRLELERRKRQQDPTPTPRSSRSVSPGESGGVKVAAQTSHGMQTRK